MAISGATSALIAAFAFGITVNAALAALFLNVKGRGSSIFRDGKRLVLIIFLISAALWAQIDFITTLIDANATGSCQVGVIFTTFFDQLARYSIEQHLLWVINAGTAAGAAQLIPQGLLGLRFVLGAVFVGFSRPQFDTVCVPVSSVLALAILVVVADAVIIATLAGRAISVGLIGKMQDGGQDPARGNAFAWVLIGLTIWMATSITMLLGIPTIDFIFRSTVPAGGLIVLLIIVTASTGAFVDDQKERVRDRRLPEAPSPRPITATRSRSIGTADSNDYPPSRYEDLKRDQITSITAFVQPREVPTVPGQGLPSTSNPGMEGQGFGGATVQGQLFPPMTAETTPRKAGKVRNQEKPKRAFFDSIGGPAKNITVGKMTISNPVIVEGSTNPLDKVAATDLETAARNERERRGLMSSQSSSALGIQPRADSTKSAAADVVAAEGVKRATSTIRKEVAGPLSSQPMPGNGEFKIISPTDPDQVAALSSQPNPLESAGFRRAASVTGSQASPGGEELRRRSPRQVGPQSSNNRESQWTVVSETAGGEEPQGMPPRQAPPKPFNRKSQWEVVSETSQTLSPPPKSPARNLPRPENQDRGVAKTMIRPSRQFPPSEPAAPEPLETPLQTRPTAGIPGNPRAKSVRIPGQPAPKREETVLFVNNIVYDDPNLVASVMDGAKVRLPRALVPAPITTADATQVIPEGPATSSSVVHRPRPIPRRKNTEDPFYPPIATPKGHRRSRSAGSLANRKSILRSNPGSPTALPPLPPPPLTANGLLRPHPNDTKSMTFDEKMNLFFPAPPSADRSKRRSSVPVMPVLDASFLDGSPTLTQNTAHDAILRDSKRTETSVQTRSIFDEQESQREEYTNATVERLDASTYQSLLDDASEDMMPEDYGQGQKQYGATFDKRASSPVLPPRMSIKSGTTVTHDDWGTEYSPVPTQTIGLAVHQARATEVGNLAPGPDQRALSTMTNSEEMTIMLDTSVARDIEQKANPDTPLSSTTSVDEGSPFTPRSSSGQRHRRFGEETLSFSSRSEKTRSRRGPPPTPLVLSDRPTTAKQAALVHAAEPSPLPSPEEALQMIQAQLRRYEQPTRGSVESPGQRALLDDLEKEMGLQETRWQGMKNDLSRDSLSTVDISPTASSRHASKAATAYVPETSTSTEDSLSRNSSTRSNLVIERTASRRSRMSSTPFMRASSHERDDVTGSSRASLWQRRLAEAQVEYMENTNELIRKRSTNFLSVSKANLGSPTPPDSDESETEIESRRNLTALLEARAKNEAAEREAAEKQAAANALLWQPPQTPENRDGLMWVRPEKPYYVPVQESPLPGLSVRPAQRKEGSTLPIRSSQLWQRPASAPSSSSGLWKSSAELQREEAERATTAAATKQAPDFYNPGIQRSRTVKARPVTQRPPRRSKRITALPDIIEDPQPLPENREILGIFQFPWGEKSDTASIQPRPAMFMAMPGTMSTGGSAVRAALDARSRQLEESEYSSSFFDDYDEDEDEGDDSSDMGSSDSDDGFDESTLFEIASLLKSTDVPSTNSMFPPPPRNATSSVLYEYVEEDDVVAPKTILGIEEEVERLQEMPSPMPPQKTRSSALWQAEQEHERGPQGKGLPQPEDWHTNDETTETARARPRLSVQPVFIESDSLWTESPDELDIDTSRSSMWTPLRAESPKPTPLRSPSNPSLLQVSQETSLPEPFTLKEALSKAAVNSLPLWQVEEQAERGDHTVGLPQPQDWAKYDDVKSTSRAKPRQADPAMIESAELWKVSYPEMPLPPSNMWKAKAGSAPVTRATSPIRQAVTQVEKPRELLWSAPASPKQTVNTGLFDLNSDRFDSRTTSEAPAAAHMTFKPRSIDWKPLDRLNTTDLWKAGPVSKAERNWITLRNTPKEVPLWSVPPSSKEVVDSGLFNPKSGRLDFRTTSQAPAAVQMSRKSRLPEAKPLERVSSTSLWAVETVTKTERNWMSPTGSPKSKTTKIPAPVARSVFPSKRQHHPIVAASKKDWDSALQQAITASYPIPQPASRKAPMQASAADWDSALQQAITASYPIPQPASRKAPMQASAADWDAALAEAVSKSYSKTFDVSKRHPVFATSSPGTQAKVVHPAAIGYTHSVAAVHPVFFGSGAVTCPFEAAHPAFPRTASNDTVSFDVSKRHPVFAASSLTTKTQLIHPAAIGYTYDVAAVHPVFFGSGVINCSDNGVHPAMAGLWVMPEDEDDDSSEGGMNPELMAQIEELEQERLFAEQWARDSFLQPPVDSTPETPLTPVAVTLATAASAPAIEEQWPFSQAQPEAAAPPEPEMLSPVSFRQLITPLSPQPTTPRSPDSAAAPPEPEMLSPVSFRQPTAPLSPQPTTPRSPGSAWLSSLVSELNTRSPKSPSAVAPAPASEELAVTTPVQEFKRADTVGSRVSELSETPRTIPLRDSLIITQSEKEPKSRGTSIQFIY